MTKFRCQHCGHRIAILPRHMGKLVRCPECGSMTHPLAEQIVAGQPGHDDAAEAAMSERQARPVKTAAAPAGPQIDPCGNCGRLIGRLETRHAWHGSVVCTGCHHMLSNPQPLVAAQPMVSIEDLDSGKSTRGKRTLAPGRVRRVEPVAARPSAAQRLLPPLRGGGPVRFLLLLCAIALAIYFVLTFVRFLGVLFNVATVGLLLLLALYFLYRGDRAGPAADPDAADSSSRLTKRP